MGREFDSETNLQYNRARYYDQNTGRFISQDPSGIELSGDYNLYRYAGNNPLNASDPTGLATRMLGQTASAVGAGLGSALGMYSSLTASLSNSVASGIASGLGSLSRPSAPIVQQVYSYNAGQYLWHDITNERVYSHDPGYGLQTRVNSPASAPQGQSQYASWASYAARGLGTGLKAVVNEGVKTIASTASLGFYEAGNVWEVNRWDRSVAKYDQAAIAARFSQELLVGAAGGTLAQSTKFGRVGAAVNTFDAASNVVSVGRGAVDVYNQGGLTWQNSAQLAGGALGFAGNAPGLRQTASDYPQLNPANYRPTLNPLAFNSGVPLGGVGLKYNAPSRSQPVHLNTNSATSNFGIYDILVQDELYKVGKADLNRITKSSGLPTRIHQQVRKLEELYDKVEVGSIQNLGRVTTTQAKIAETARLQAYFEQTGKIPLRNVKSFKPQ